MFPSMVTDYQSTWLQYWSYKNNGLYLTRALPVSQLPMLSHLKALKLEFGKTGFKKEKDHGAYLAQVLEETQLEYLDIERTEKITELPTTLADQPLQYLVVGATEIKDFSSVLPKLSSLKGLSLSGKEITIGLQDGDWAKLNSLMITAEKVRDIEHLGNLKNLEHLHLRIKHLDEFPDSFCELKQLKTLTIYGGAFTSLPDAVNFPQLESIYLSGLSLTSLPKTLFTSPLQKVSINYFRAKTFELAGPLDVQDLEELEVAHLPMEAFPQLSAPSLKKLHLKNLPISQLGHCLGEVPRLEELFLNEVDLSDDSLANFQSPNLKSYAGSLFSTGEEMDLAAWPLLEKLTISGNPQGVTLQCQENNQLKTLSIRNDEKLTELSGVPLKTEDLSLVECHSLKGLNASLVHLKKLELKGLDSLTELRLGPDDFPILEELEISKCPNLAKLSGDLLALPVLRSLRIDDEHKIPMEEGVWDFKALLKLFEKKKFKPAERAAVGFWLLGNDSHEKVSDDIKNASLACLQYGNETVYRLIVNHLKQFNPEGRGFLDFSESELKGKSFCIVGKTFGTKTALKDKLKELEMKAVRGADKAEFLILGKKCEIADLGSNVVLVSEQEVNEFSDQANPGFLKEESVSEEMLDNLERIVLSQEPANELLALEMMKTGGLPADLIPACLVIAKTSTDKSVRAKYKRFLKGKLDDAAAQVLAANVRFNTYKNPIQEFAELSDRALAGQFAWVYYQRTGHGGHNVLEYHEGDPVARKRVLEEVFYPEWLAKPHYVKTFTYLTCVELEELLDMPVLQGELKRLHIRTKDKRLPSNLTNHTALKELVLGGENLPAKFPEEIFKLTRLSELNYNGSRLTSIGPGIADLKLLKKILVYNNKKVRLPDEFASLKKLKRAYFSGGVQEPEKWKEFLEGK